MGVGGQHHAPAALPPGETPYPLYRRLGGPQGRSGRLRKISPTQGFDHRTVQPVASRYTDWATPAADVGEGGMDWIDLAQDRDSWRALVSTVMNFQVP